MIILEFYLMFRPTCDIKYSMVTYNFKGLKRKVTNKLANGWQILTDSIHFNGHCGSMGFSNIFGCAQLQPDLECDKIKN